MQKIEYKKPIIVAEIGCNHKGDIDIAFELIDIAKKCGANVAKFQKRNPKELLSEEQFNTPHPRIFNSYGKTYGEHREFLEFSQRQHAELMEYCKIKGIGYATSVWDITSAREIIELKPNYIKVPSACNNNQELIKTLCDNYSGNIHISLGMTTKKEEKSLIKLLGDKNCLKRVVLYACTSGYPVPFNELYLLEILRLKKLYLDKVHNIGYSGHHLGIAADIAAYTLGSIWIERHFTKDRTWKGTDHAASLEPMGLEKLVRDLNAVHESLRFREEEISEIENQQRIKLKYKA